MIENIEKAILMAVENLNEEQKEYDEMSNRVLKEIAEGVARIEKKSAEFQERRRQRRREFDLIMRECEQRTQ